MKHRNKKEVLDLARDYVKIGEKCRDCVHSDESTIPIAIRRCTCNKPKTAFHYKRGCWICFSFSQMLDNNENIVKKRDGKK